MRPHYVYLVKALLFNSNLCKIGISNDVEARFRSLYQAFPFSIEIVSCFHSMTAKKDERELRRIFGSSRVKGEWFYLTDDDVAIFNVYFTSRGGWNDYPICLRRVTKYIKLSGIPKGVMYTPMLYKELMGIPICNTKKSDVYQRGIQ